MSGVIDRQRERKRENNESKYTVQKMHCTHAHTTTLPQRKR